MLGAPIKITPRPTFSSSLFALLSTLLPPLRSRLSETHTPLLSLLLASISMNINGAIDQDISTKSTARELRITNAPPPHRPSRLLRLPRDVREMICKWTLAELSIPERRHLKAIVVALPCSFSEWRIHPLPTTSCNYRLPLHDFMSGKDNRA